MTMPAPIKAQRSRAPDDNSPHILVVDDDSRIRDLLARYLQEHGFRVTTAVDAASARATMRSLSFDLLILDVMMPQKFGLDLARSLRREVPAADPHADGARRARAADRGSRDWRRRLFGQTVQPPRASAACRQCAPPRRPPTSLRRGAHGEFRLSYRARRAQARR